MTGKIKTSVVVADGSLPTSTAPLLGSYEQVCRQAADIGFDGLTLTVQDPAEVDIAALQGALGRYGLQAAAIATGRAYSQEGLWLASPQPETRQRAVRRMLEHIRLSQALADRPRVIVGAIRGRSTGPDLAECRRLLRDSMEQIMAAAEQARVEVLFEAIDYLESDMYRQVGETAEFIRSFHSPRLLLQLDTMHLLNEGEDIRADLPGLADIIGQVDLSGAERAVPGPGDPFDFPGFLEALADMDYQDWLLLEHKPTPGGAKAGYEYVRSLLRR